MSDAAPDRARIRIWLFDEALPHWATAGVDRANGGFVEAMTLDGAPLGETDRRLRVQARQVYVFSHAALSGWPGPALETAARGFEYMTRHYWHDDGGWIFSAGADTTPRDTTRATYEQAFALLALAWYARAGGQGAALDWAGRTLQFMDRQLGDGVHGGYREAVPDAPPRRQNPHMHLLEALLALYHTTRDGAYLDRARAVVELFRRHFFDAKSGTLGEFFTDDWRPRDGVEGQWVEPGHHFEWVWLLHQYCKATGEDLRAEAEALYRFAEAHGVDPVDGLAYDAIRRDGSVVKRSKRCWPQTEALKAQLVMADWQGADTGARVQAITRGLFDRYLSQGRGIWQDRLDEHGDGAAAHVPASTFYHLFLAFSEYLRATV